MTKEAQQRLQQRIINNLHSKLFYIEMALQRGPTGMELQLLEQHRVKIEARLMTLYGTEKYGLVK